MKKMLQIHDHLYQDEIGVYQLQIVLACGSISDVSDNEIEYSTSENDFTLHYLNNKLIAQPGTVDFIHDIDDAYFEIDDQLILLHFKRGEKIYTYPIGYNVR